MKKSQIQQIKEGRAMHEKVWSGRLQPYGPRVDLRTENAVKLTTIPSSAEEKYKGGQE
ncbi:MAG TPA: hypothetical protein VF111_15800 [Thermoanaerobaculia bacterium]